MLNEEKIRIMTNLARYESGVGKKDLRISKYYRSEYVGMGLFKNLVLTMLGYFLLWTAAVVYNLDYILKNLHKMNLPVVVFEFVLGYLVVLVFYSFLTYYVRVDRYKKAKKHVEGYERALLALTSVYGENNQKRKKELLGGDLR